MAPGRASAVSLILVGIAGTVIILSAAADVAGRGTSPEITVRAYFAALEHGDEEAALSAIEPGARAMWSSFVSNGLGNTYQVEGIAVHEQSLLQRIAGQEPGPRDVTIFVHITEWSDGTEWR